MSSFFWTSVFAPILGIVLTSGRFTSHPTWRARKAAHGHRGPTVEVFWWFYVVCWLACYRTLGKDLHFFPLPKRWIERDPQKLALWVHTLTLNLTYSCRAVQKYVVVTYGSCGKSPLWWSGGPRDPAARSIPRFQDAVTDSRKASARLRWWQELNQVRRPFCGKQIRNHGDFQRGYPIAGWLISWNIPSF